MLDGAATSASAKPRRCCARWTSGPGGGCVPSPGSNGSADARALLSCASRGVGRHWRRKPPAARTALGGSATARARSIALPNAFLDSLGLPSLVPTRPHNPPNRRVRTRMHGGVGGAKPEASPYPDCGSGLSRPRVNDAVRTGHSTRRHRLPRGVGAPQPGGARAFSRLAAVAGLPVSLTRYCRRRFVVHGLSREPDLAPFAVPGPPPVAGGSEDTATSA